MASEIQRDYDGDSYKALVESTDAVLHDSMHVRPQIVVHCAKSWYPTRALPPDRHNACASSMA